MSLILEVLGELFGMFVSDWPLSAAVIVVVAAAFVLSRSGVGGSAAVAGVLVLGALTVLAGAVWRAGRRKA